MLNIRKSICLILILTATVAVSRAADAAAPKKRAAKPAAAAPAPQAAPAGVLLDNFEAADWGVAMYEGNALTVGRDAGKAGGALKLTYDLKQSKQWVQIHKPIPVNSMKGKALEFWVKGTGAANTLEVKLIDADGTNFGVKKEGVTKSADWTRVLVNDYDLTYFWGGDKDLGAVKEIYFAVSAGEGGAGEVLIDELKLVDAQKAPAAAAMGGGTIADGETTDGWDKAAGSGATISLATEAGAKGKALAIDYSIPANQWVSVRRTANMSVPKNGAFVFQIKGSGDANNVEFKLVDRDDSTFGKVLEGQAGKNGWQEIRVPVSDLKYLWGGDNQLDLSLVKFIDIAISGPGGKGKVLVDDLKLQ